MLRNARRIAPLLRALLLGSVTASATVMATGTLVGCTDEQDPNTHVERLSDPVRRSQAVDRLLKFYSDAMNRDKGDRNGPTVKPLLDLMVEPMGKLIINGDLDRRAQAEVLTFLADTRDKRALPAVLKALGDYRPDDKRGDKYDAAMGNVVRNLGVMKAKEASPHLIKLFVNLRASTAKAGYKQFYKILHDALLEMPDKAWEGELIALLKRPVKTLKDIKTLKNEVYWQTTAAELLGVLKSEKAVPELIKVVLSPLKADIAATAVSSLIKIGKPSIAVGVKLLNGELDDMEAYAKEQNLASMKDRGIKVNKKAEKNAEKAYLGAAAIIVANIGRAECKDPMLKAMESGDALTKAIIGRELHKLPSDPAITEAFKKAWTDTSLTATIPPGLNAKEQLTTAVGSFFEKDMANWLAESSLKLKGEEADTGPIQETALLVMLKSADKSNWQWVDKLGAVKITYPKVSTIGKSFKKEIGLAKEVVDKCGDKVDCYYGVLKSPEAQKKKTQFKGLKAAYMIGILGGPDTPKKLVKALPQVSNAANRFVVAGIIDRKSPKGDKALADAIQKIIDTNVASKDRKRIQGDAPLKTVVHRLRARAQ